mgnify:CR=1 FL=1
MHFDIKYDIIVCSMAKKAYNLALGVTMRAIRAFVAGFLATAVTVSLGSISSWTELSSALGNLALAGVIGGISALLMAGDKYFRAS